MTVTSLEVFLFLICATVLDGVKLPGACPKVPATHKFPARLTLNQELILGVPFTDPNTTNLFKDFNSRNVNAYLFIINTNNATHLEQLQLIRKEHHAINLFSIKVEFASGSDSYYLRSWIDYTNDSYFSFSCHDIIEVNVRIWYDSSFVIIWSCRETNNIDHEEGVVMVALHDNPNFTYHGHFNDYKQMLKRLKEMARKFLRDSLLNTIQWSHSLTLANPPWILIFFHVQISVLKPIKPISMLKASIIKIIS